MYYHLILTDDCNLCCSYCRGKMFCTTGGYNTPDIEIDTQIPSDISYDLRALYHFLEQDPDPCLTFYGGEPLIRDDIIRQIMDQANIRRYILQTNGTLLGNLEPGYVNRFETILVSIDGPESLTDLNRGRGTYKRIMAAIKKAVKEGFDGEIIARMTVTEDTDIFRAVKYLERNPDFSFQSIHWQMDADFSQYDPERNFGDWLEYKYNPGILKLIRDWKKCMECEGKIKKWYPFLAPASDMLHGKSSRLRCGSGYANYTIMPDGNIGPCPVMIGMKKYYLGHIETSSPSELGEVSVSGWCPSCEIKDFCGGRCLYSNIMKPWPDEQRKMICDAVRNLHQGIQAALPDIRRLLKDGVIRADDFHFIRYNGCEIIP